MMGIDTPESDALDFSKKEIRKSVEKHMKKLLEEAESLSLISHDRGKFGKNPWYPYSTSQRRTSSLWCKRVNINEQMIADHHAVQYTGQNKDDIKEMHLNNRKTSCGKPKGML